MTSTSKRKNEMRRNAKKTTRKAAAFPKVLTRGLPQLLPPGLSCLFKHFHEFSLQRLCEVPMCVTLLFFPLCSLRACTSVTVWSANAQNAVGTNLILFSTEKKRKKLGYTFFSASSGVRNSTNRLLFSLSKPKIRAFFPPDPQRTG